MSTPGSTGVPHPAEGTPQIQHCGAPQAEYRDPRFAELDALIQVDAERRQHRPQPKRRSRRRSDPGIPAAVRKEITWLARELNQQYRDRFISDPKLKDRTSRLLRSLLPPKPRRRGRPGIPSVTVAIRLLQQFRRQYPRERGEEIWRRIYPKAIPRFDAMTEAAQNDARHVLRERVRWRRRARTG